MLYTLPQPPLRFGDDSPAAGSATLLRRAQLVLAANPCPCTTAAGDIAYTRSPLERRRYRSFLSGRCSTSSTSASTCRRSLARALA